MFFKHTFEYFFGTEYAAVDQIARNAQYACDLGIDGREIYGRILIHHMNPILIDDIVTASEFLLNPDYLISTTHNTHNAIHYGDVSLLVTAPIERTKNDTCPWRH